MLFVGMLIVVFSTSVHTQSNYKDREALNRKAKLLETKQICPYLWILLERGLYSADIKTIVNTVNKHRLKIARGTLIGQPRGIDLKKVSHDSGLANKSRSISNTCKKQTWDLSDDRWSEITHSSEMECGQSLDRKRNWSKILDIWFKGHANYKYPTNSKIRPTLTSYSQMVWANTTKIGCDYILFQKPNASIRGKYCKMYTCFFGPGGIEGQIPYTVGCDQLC